MKAADVERVRNDLPVPESGHLIPDCPECGAPIMRWIPESEHMPISSRLSLLTAHARFNVRDDDDARKSDAAAPAA